jgi:salicylate hydroxylase
MNGTFLNIAIFTYEPSEFPNPDKMTARGTREDIERALQGWGPHITEIVKLFSEEQVKWGIFDMFEHPAHASTPFQGVGACMGVEDALVICELLDMVQARMGDGASAQSNKLAIEKALQAYSQSRIPRSQWQVRSSREMGEMYQWRHEQTGRDVEKCRTELEEATRKVWDFNVDNMVAEAKKKVET